MGADSSIQWCHDTLNVWHGCTKVDALCKHCYAEVSTPVRVKRAGGLEVWGPHAARSETKSWEANLRSYARKAIATGKRRRVFAQSLSDTFEDRADLAPMRTEFFEAIERLTWMDGSPLIIGESPLDLLLLTKRPEHILRMVPAHWLTAWPSYVWIGTSVGTQASADERIPHLLRVPAAVRFLSVEPQLEAIVLQGGNVPEGPDGPWHPPPWHDRKYLRGVTGDERVSWVIQGGESGPRARSFDLAWARTMRDQCRAAGVAYFFKQAGAKPVSGPYMLSYGPLHDSHGGDESEWPADLRGCRAFPVPHG